MIKKIERKGGEMTYSSPKVEIININLEESVLLNQSGFSENEKFTDDGDLEFI